VRAADHWCTDLRGYTCAAAPVLEPATGGLAGSIDLTTWSDSSSELLLGLAQTAASATSALMAARSSGRLVRPAPRGEVFRVLGGGPAGDDGDPCVSAAWRSAVGAATAAVATGRGTVVVGEPGSGRATLAVLAVRQLPGHRRSLHARAPGTVGTADVAAWPPADAAGAARARRDRPLPDRAGHHHDPGRRGARHRPGGAPPHDRPVPDHTAPRELTGPPAPDAGSRPGP
jgi:hypothetical protein